MTSYIFRIKNLHLGCSSLSIIAIALTYGIYPSKILPVFFDFRVETIDLNNIFRAVMGLYLSFAIYWIIGICNQKIWKNATYTCILFMGGLAFGRIISLMLDGVPSFLFSLGIVLEILFMIWGIINLRANLKIEKNQIN